MKKWLTVIGGLFSLLSNATSAEEAGIVFGQSTRLIFSLEKSAERLSVRNDSENHYLLHTKVLSSDNDRTLNTEFMVTPEVFELKPKERTTLTVRRLGGDYPTDRESLLYVVGRFIPNSTTPSTSNKFELAYSITMKMFLRPKALNVVDAIEASKEKVDFSYQDKKLIIKNQSPYYMTFYELKVNGKEIQVPKHLKMLAPFGTNTLEYSGVPRKIEWSFIGDSGYETPQSQRILR